ncbi:MAG: polysaccharide biosynthesis protein [Deltaproteobacteria bacterium]|nr:polysaccharide biosynthesis protein [Kofleriaceae bacterium]
MLLDFVLVTFGVLLAYVARFEGSIPAHFFRHMLVVAPVLAMVRILVNAGFGVYRLVWRYVGLLEAVRMAQAVATVSVLLLLFRLTLPSYLPQLSLPLSIIVMEGMFTFLAMAGVRFVPRILRERVRRRDGAATLLIGAGQGGLAIVKEAVRHPELGIRPIGFIDDDPTKHGMEIASLRILGTLRDLDRVIRAEGAERVVITSSSFAPKAISRVMDVCNPLGVQVQIVQGTYERLGGPGDPAETVKTVREVRIEDLLSRDPVPPSLSRADLIETFSGKRVLVTGAGGSIGSELCRQLAHMQPAQLILVERDETNLFHIERELVAAKMGHVTVPLLLDVMDAKAVERAFKELQPQVVFHAAAYKHVPMMERFPWEAVRNNVFATKQLIELAEEHQVETFVMISTDKAINPTSVMGATKRFAEQIVQDFATRAKTRFSCVRFGNVLGSRGSVVGIFAEQIAAGGPVTVTHPEATRYFMTIPEAANLVIQASTIGHHGEVFLLDMGEPVRIIDLARQMIRLSGFTEEEVPIRIVGTRPGEKLFEELSTIGENLAPTELRKIHRCKPVPVDPARVNALVERFHFTVRGRDAEGIRTILAEMEIGYQSPPPGRTLDAQ